jgi:ligand-binding SRPBCC domain-containing protein
MTSIDHEIEIEAPIEYVFEWGTTPENWMRSTPALLDVEVIDETDQGTTYRNTLKMLGRTTTSDELYTVDEENYRTTSVYLDEDFSGEMVFDHTETETGTHVHLYGDIETGTSLFDRTLRPVVIRYMNRQFRNSLKTMKELVETEYAAEERAPVEA